MKKTCLIVGAGFSKAIADLPLTKEMLPAFMKEIEHQRSLGKESIAKRGERLFYFLKNLENDFLKIPYSRAEKGGIILESNYLENFEGLCSFIDLNLAFEINAICESNGIKANLSGKPLFGNYTSSRLKEMKGYIKNYLYFTLINANPDENLLIRFFEKFLQNYPTVITFNYDIILEKYLFQNKSWVPRDGYGFTLYNIPELNPRYKNDLSKIKILKMHGSLNWIISPLYHLNLEIKWFDEDNNFFFPGYLNKESGRPIPNRGAFSSESWILPSWIKQFTYKEILEVWKQAYMELSKAEEVIFIGYSLPSADSAVYSLFSAVDWSRKVVKVYDPNAEELAKNYSFILRKNKIELFSEFLNNILT